MAVTVIGRNHGLNIGEEAGTTNMDPKSSGVSVTGLSRFSDLESIARRSGLKLSSSTKDYILRQTLNGLGNYLAQKVVKQLVLQGDIEWELTNYEVEAILDYASETKDGERIDLYLVKWMGWTLQHNSWEPKIYLNCPELLKEFHRLQECGKTSRSRTAVSSLTRKERSEQYKRNIGDIFEKLRQHDIPISKIIKIARGCSKRKADFDEPDRFKPRMKRPRLSITQNITNKRSKAYQVLRQERDRALQEWQRKINAVDNNQASITVENTVDLEGPPDNFTYVNDYMAGEGVELSTEPLVGCECTDCFKEKNKCCGPCAGGEFAYYKAKKIRVTPGMPIYECNSLCKCGPECPNRVVQFGRRYKVCVFKTSNGRGWGLKAMQLIKKGSFVAEYVGEVITNEEAERRGRIYDDVGQTYLFDLDFDEDSPFSVDAGRYGNVSHFINHSCDPNLAVYSVWINSLDPRLPRIALFAQRDIAPHEEITFNYMMTGAMTGGLNSSGLNGHSSELANGEDGSESTPSVSSSEADVSSNPSDMASPAVLDRKSRDKPLPPTPPETPPPIQLKRIICQCGAKNCEGYLL